MAGASLTYENAPRDVSKLMSFGRYTLRNLAYEIDMISQKNPDAVTAFDRLQLRDRAQEVLNTLERLDKEKGKNGEAKETKTKPKRQPVKPKETKTEAKPAKEPVKVNGGGVEAALLQQVAELRKIVEEQDSKIDNLNEQLNTVIRICKANMYMNGLVGEHIMQGNLDEMLTDGFDGGEKVEVPVEGN